MQEIGEDRTIKSPHFKKNWYVNISSLGLTITILLRGHLLQRVNTQPYQNSFLPAEKIHYVGHFGGSAQSVAINEQYAYLGIGPELAILDISDPNQPIRMSHLLLADVVEDIYAYNDHVYIAMGNEGLLVVEVSNPNLPKKLSNNSNIEIARRLAASENYIYVAGEGLGIEVVDISKPTNPIVVATIDTPGSAYSIAVEGNFAYVADLHVGLQIIDISDPLNPKQVGYYDTPGFVIDLDVQNNLVYLADHDYGIWIVDVLIPSTPSLVGYYQSNGTAQGISVSDDLIYLAAGDAGLRVIRFTKDYAPKEIGYLNTSGTSRRVTLMSNQAYLIDGSLRIIDITDPTLPFEIGSYTLPWNPLALELQGDNAYIADSSNGLHIVDLINKKNPKLITTMETPGFAQDLVLNGQYVYLSDWQSVYIYDIDEPQNPREIGVYSGFHMAWSIDVVDEYAYICDDEYGLWILDVSDPSTPTLEGRYNSPGFAADVEVVGNIAYVADWHAGLRIVDISKKTQPQELSHLDTAGQALGIVIHGNQAFVADGSNGLTIIDISDPNKPAEQASLNISGFAEDLAMDNNIVYLAAGSAGLKVIDVTQPLTPTEIGYFDTPGYAESVTLSKGDIYVSDSWGGVVILKHGLQKLQGQVLEANGLPVKGVSLSIQEGITTTTEESGLYTLNFLPSGQYTLTPSHPYYNFQPPFRQATVPPNAYAQNFTMLPQPVSITLAPDTASTLVFSDTQGLQTQLEIPSGAVEVTTTLILTPTIARAPFGFANTGHSFLLEPQMVFSKPVTVTIQHSQNDIRLISNKEEILLGWRTLEGWKESSQTCSTKHRSTAPYISTFQGTTTHTICQTGMFSLLGPTKQIILPVIFQK